MLRFGSLFAGIGGFDLGFERAGMQCAWQVEIDPYCRKVLAKHWPDVRRWDDVKTFPPEPASDWGVDLICGGFPCQDISNAGKRAGIDGERSGLWSEFARIIRTLRPNYVVVENVAALLVRGIDRVLGDLAASGFDAEWDVLGACDFGAPHIRERLFIVAHAETLQWEAIFGEQSHRVLSHVFTNAHGERLAFGQSVGRNNGEKLTPAGRADCVSCDPDTCDETGYEGGQDEGPARYSQRRFGTGRSAWHTEPYLDRVAYGVPSRVDRLGCLGNAVVPQVAEWIGRRIVQAKGDDDGAK